MLTSKDGEYDETEAFELGADDYLTKPFRFRALIARLYALVRRGVRASRRTDCRHPNPRSIPTIGHARRYVHFANAPRVQRALIPMRKKDTVVTKTEIVQGVWDWHFDGPDNIVEVYVQSAPEDRCPLWY